jgi:Electron transfer DM13
MSRLMVLFMFTFLIVSCSKDDNTDTTTANDPVISTGTVLAQGSLSGNMNYKVSGVAKVIEDNGVKSVRLENFSSNNGPDLKVYLAKDVNAASFINLGNLKSTSGNQNYAFTGSVTLSEYKYILIWCQQFGVLFGSAQLN